MSVDMVLGTIRVKVIRPTSLLVAIGPTVVRQIQITEGTGPVDINLGDNQFTTIHLHGLDAAGLEGKFVSPPTWEVADPSIVQITPEPDGTACRIEAATPPKLGTTTITVTDTDDPNVPSLVFNVTVGGEQIITLGATVDPPTEKSAPQNP